MKACCGFGHRNVFENIEDKLYTVVMSAAGQGYVIFYTGAMGEFDSLFSYAVRKAKKVYPNIKRVSDWVHKNGYSETRRKKLC